MKDGARTVTTPSPLIEALKRAREWLSCVEGHLRDGQPFKRDLAKIDEVIRIATETTEPDADKEAPPPKAWLEAKAEVDAGWPEWAETMSQKNARSQSQKAIRAEALEDIAKRIEKLDDSDKEDEQNIQWESGYSQGIEDAASLVRICKLGETK